MGGLGKHCFQGGPFCITETYIRLVAFSKDSDNLKPERLKANKSGFFIY